jgi:tRNA(Ile)-lysidine synthase TilS/MesJ
MAKKSQANSERMGVKHVNFKIPWSSGVYPERPAHGKPIENAARMARFHALFDCMTATQVDTIAFGHHGDDQVETALIRLSKGSTEYGASGMQACRRWGMGEQSANGFGYYGYDGLKRWIVRPMLEFSKVLQSYHVHVHAHPIHQVPQDRILATCEENKLEYVIDPTNFHPEVTLRNAIRHKLKQVQDRTGVCRHSSVCWPELD